MKYYKKMNNQIISSVGVLDDDENFNDVIMISKSEFDDILIRINNSDLNSVIEETTTAYTAEQLEAMTSTELKAICIELGIPTSMVKQNMIDLILGKQNET